MWNLYHHYHCILQEEKVVVRCDSRAQHKFGRMQDESKTEGGYRMTRF